MAVAHAPPLETPLSRCSDRWKVIGTPLFEKREVVWAPGFVGWHSFGAQNDDDVIDVVTDVGRGSSDRQRSGRWTHVVDVNLSKQRRDVAREVGDGGRSGWGRLADGSVALSWSWRRAAGASPIPVR
jgi:hypothetical protein